MVSLVVQLYLDDFVSLVVKFLVNIFPFLNYWLYAPWSHSFVGFFSTGVSQFHKNSLLHDAISMSIHLLPQRC